MWSKPARPQARHLPAPGAARRRRRDQLEERLRTAESHLARGRHEAARRQLLAIAADGPRDLSQLNRLGDGLVRADCMARGIVLFERVGRAYADDGFWAKAIAIYKKILRHDPWRSDIRTRLAFLYQRSGLPVGSTSV